MSPGPGAGPSQVMGGPESVAGRLSPVAGLLFRDDLEAANISPPHGPVNKPLFQDLMLARYVPTNLLSSTT